MGAGPSEFATPWSSEDERSSRGNENRTNLKLDIPFDSFERLRPLAQGSTCNCQRGMMVAATKQAVVIKTLKPGSSEIAARDLDRELEVLKMLHHSNIVELFGAGHAPQGGIFIALEFLTRRTLSRAIGTDAPEGTDWISRALVRSRFPMKEAFRQAAGVASALAYMHDTAIPGAKVVHRDIKSTNLGFTANGTLKLFDFGLVKILRPTDSAGDNVYKMTGETGSLRYMPPEVAKSLPSNETVDAYSFALVMWEMVSIEQPFQFYGVKELLRIVINGGKRPKLASHWPEDFKDILRSCWSADISRRPSMADVENRLLRLLPAVSDNKSGQ